MVVSKFCKTSCFFFLKPKIRFADEEHDFERGLAFPAINASESSDDEFNLDKEPRKKQRRPRRRKKSGDKSPYSLPPDTALEVVTTDDALSQKSCLSERLTPELDVMAETSLHLPELGQELEENGSRSREVRTIPSEGEELAEADQTEEGIPLPSGFSSDHED